jgi:hypothetical protein
MTTTHIARALSSIEIGPDVAYENLVMFPLLRKDTASRIEPPAFNPGTRQDAPYDVLDDALASGAVEVTEVSTHGSVPELRVISNSPRPTLIVDGQELIGAKQNRVVNLTLLVAAHSGLTIPVSCVEAGRWRARSRTFSSAPRTQYAAGRAQRMSQVTRSMQTHGSYRADQSAVWADIAEKSARLKTHSPTGAMEAMFVDHAAFIDSCVDRCQPVAGQVGAVFVIDGRVLGFDLFDCESTLRKLLSKLVRGVALDALDAKSARSERQTAIDTPRLDLFLAAVSGASCHASPAVGVGQDVRLTAPGITGAALVVDEQVVHLSAFALA